MSAQILKGDFNAHVHRVILWDEMEKRVKTWMNVRGETTDAQRVVPIQLGLIIATAMMGIPWIEMERPAGMLMNVSQIMPDVSMTVSMLLDHFTALAGLVLDWRMTENLAMTLTNVRM